MEFDFVEGPNLDYCVTKMSFYVIVYFSRNIKMCNDGVTFECEVFEIIKVDENIMLDDLKKINIMC